MAYTTDGTANFNFFINRQGPRGPQGIQGPEGFSPNVEVEEDYGNTFTLRITNKDSSFVTSNLREHKEDRGGTYVRWDRETEQMYLGDASIPAATDNTAGIIRISDENDIKNKTDNTAITPKQLIENIDTAKEELQTSIDANTQVINSVKSQMVTLEGDQVVSGKKIFSNLVSDKIYSELQDKVVVETFSDSLNILTNLSAEGVIRNSNGIVIDESRLGNTLVKNEATEKYDVRLATNDVAGIVKPDGNTITITEDGTISSIAQGDVTAAGDNIFTGHNTFKRKTIFTGSTVSGDPDLVINKSSASPSIIQFGPTGTLILQSKDSDTVKDALGISYRVIQPYTDIQAAYDFISTKPYYLHQESIIAGDNINITKTEKGVSISSTASGGAEIDDTTPATDKVYSSSKTQALVNGIDSTIARLSTELSNALNVITALETRVQALEDLIDGGNAGSTYPADVITYSTKLDMGVGLSENTSLGIDTSLKVEDDNTDNN